MGRTREYQSAADRQRAYRERVRAQAVATSPTCKNPAPPRRKSRLMRLAAIEDEVRSLLGEYEAWLAALPGSLAESEQAARLAVAIEGLGAIAEALGEIDPPRGFGRD